jgi:hypothetical protein
MASCNWSEPGRSSPPVTLTGLEDLLVTDAFRSRLEHSPMAGTGFRPVQRHASSAWSGSAGIGPAMTPENTPMAASPSKPQPTWCGTSR